MYGVADWGASKAFAPGFYRACRASRVQGSWSLGFCFMGFSTYEASGVLMGSEGSFNLLISKFA